MPIPPSSESLERVDFYPRLYIPSARFATLSDEEWERLEKEAIEDYKDWLRDMRALHKERQRQHIIELARRIESRRLKRPFHRSIHADSIPALKKKLQNILRRNQVEAKKSEWLDTLKFLENYDAEAILEKWLKETATSRKMVTASGFDEEEFVKQLEEEKKIVQLAIPIFREIVAIHDERIQEIEKAMAEKANSVKKANEIRNKILKDVEKEGKLIDAMCEADSFGRHKELDKLLDSYRPLKAKIDKQEAEYNQICSQIYQARIAPPDLLSFPPRKLVKLKLHDRIWKRL